VESVGCVILRGEGRSFSSGNDLRAIQAGEAAPSPHFQAETLDAIEALPQPVIASVRGHCYTGALPPYSLKILQSLQSTGSVKTFLHCVSRYSQQGLSGS
jgi:hypothetical protein